MHVLHLRNIEPHALSSQVYGLTPYHAERPARLGQQIDQPQSYRRSGRQPRVTGEQLKRERLQKMRPLIFFCVDACYRRLPQKRWMRVQASSSALVAVA